MKTRYIILFLFVLALANPAWAQLSGYKISIDPGHGGTDVGATGIDGGAVPNEEDLVLEAGLALRTRFQNAGATVTMTRSSDWQPSLTARRDHFNAENPDAAISIHLNSATATALGTETWYYYNTGLANAIQNNLIAEMGLVNRGVKQNGWTVITCNSSIPACLTEGCFISNQSDFNFITSAAGKEKWITGHEKGVYAFFGVSYTQAPAQATLLAVENTATGLQLSWKANTEANLSGYRLYWASPEAPTTWSLAANEAQLTAATTSKSFASPANFQVPASGSAFFFKLKAVNSLGLESDESDTYAATFASTAGKQKVLIVDGFDRITGSYTQKKHAFATSYFNALRAASADIVLSSCANEQAAYSSILSQYDAVLWFVGDESTTEFTFYIDEQTAIKSYLENGGKLLVSGSEIGWDLWEKGDATDRAFFTNYLKATYVNDGAGNLNPATGVAGSAFAGLSLNFGQVYPEDYPDVIDPVAGGTAAFRFNNATGAGTAYTGTVGAGTQPAQVVYLSFPLETVSSATELSAFSAALIDYFGLEQPVGEPAPIADFSANQTLLLQGGSVTFVNASANAASYQWSFVGGSPATSTQETPVVSYATAGLYPVQLIAISPLGQRDTLLRTAYIHVASPSIAVPELCYLSATSDNKHRLVWAPEATEAIAAYNIYREGEATDAFDLVATVPYAQAGEWIDADRNPAVMAARYRLAALRIDQAETALGSPHKSIHLTINAGLNGAWNLIWDTYQGFAYNSYRIYRGSSATDMVEIARVPATYQSYADLSAPVGQTYYAIAIDAPNCGAKKSGERVFSNVASSRALAVESAQGAAMRVYPNPASESIEWQISGASAHPIRAEIYTLNGQKCLTLDNAKSNQSISINALQPGQYVLKISQADRHYTQRFVKQ